MEGENGLVELITPQECNTEVAAVAFAFVACKTEEALRIAAEGVTFARTQTALYGA